MKKIIYSALAMTFAFFAASCQQENLEPVAESNTVTYTVQVPGAMSTKALGDETTDVNEVYYQVYRAAEVDYLDKKFVYDGTEDVNDAGQASFELDFVKGQDFVVLFWAQNSTLDMYNTTDLRKVQLVKPGNANNAAAQVFAGSNVVTDCVPANNGNVELTRPISQLNIFTTKESLKYGTSDIVLSTSSVTVSGLYSTYNVAEGAAVVKDANNDDVATVEYEYEAFKVPATENGAENVYVAMNYVGFAPNAGATVNVDFTITTEGEVNPISHSVSSVPVKPNYRTNIVGNLLTEAADYDVTLDAAWADEEYTEVVVSTAVDLQTEVYNILDGETGEITLAGDIDFGDLVGSLTRATSAPASLIIPAEKTVVLNLNGHTLSQTAGYAGHSMIVNNGTLTLTGEGTIRYTYNGTPDSLYGKGNQTISNFGTLVLNGPTVENATEKMSHALFAIDTREGATFNVVDGAVLCANATAVRMGQFGADANEMTVEGGRIYGGRAVQMHLPSSSATVNPRMTLDVQGGVLESNDETYNIGIYVLSNGQSAENVTVEIGGEAHIKGSVLVNAAATDSMNDAAIQITGGTIDGIYGVYSYSTDPAKADAVISVTGGAFAVKPNYVDPAYEAKEQDGKYVVVAKPEVAKIGETGYWSLNAAVAAVKDGETITLVADEVFNEVTRMNSGGTWYEGLYYIGDKSFTIDLNNFTITQNGAVNDYLFLFKNDGAKANVITFKNGKLDAGTSAYCALCTSTTSTQKITINVENVDVVGNNSGGAVCKIRGGAEFNVKAGTIITGKNSYVGIEAAGNNTVVNVYDGAEIYQNGTSSYVGSLVGVSGTATVNVYGGYGKSASGGFIAMTSGGTINVAGGEWIANTDGTYANDNKSVLIAQSSKGAKSIVNVTGGTFKGGYNCYGDAVGDAQINISGGNFNVNPSAYLEDACEATENAGVWTVRVLPAAKIGETEYATLQDAFNVGGNITLVRDVATAETVVLAEGKTAVLDLNGKTLSAADKNTLRNDGGNLTIMNGTVTRTGDSVGYSVNNASGEISVENATIARGLYTSGSKLTANNANISHEQSSRHAIYSWNCEVTINSGTFHNDNAGNATLMASGSSVVTINGGTFSIADGRSTLGWTSCMIDQNGTAQVTVKGGLFNGGFRINSADTILSIEGGEFNTNNGSAYTDYSGTKVVKGGKFTDAGAQNWAKKYIADGYEMNTDGEVVAK